ncbi:hypothetical protein [Cellulomonas sp. P5_C6]
MSQPALARAARRARARDVARRQAGLLTRWQARGLGITQAQLEAELAAERWHVIGRHTLVVAPSVPDDRRDWWLAILESAPRAILGDTPRAALAGITALHAAGLSGITGDGSIHVAAPKSSRPLAAPPSVRVHETRRWRDDDVITLGVLRVRVEVAAVQAALWARTDREAALMLIAPIQQRLTSGQAVSDVLAQVRRDKRRSVLRAVMDEIADGVASLNELDFAALCRRRGLPEPERQVVVTGSGGRAYLDVRWTRWRVVAEIDGIGHLRPDQWIDDSLRHNAIVLGGETVLRIPSLGLRLDPDRHLDAVERALRQSGWTPVAHRPDVRARTSPDT